MKIEVQIISKEIINPSSPTPHHLRHYQLSFLDQISPPVYNPLVMFYAQEPDSNLNNVEKSTKLKTSLSEILTSFYPLAGRLQDNQIIDCNDKGIPYFEARVRCQISPVIQNPVPGELSKLLPFEVDHAQDVPFAVQFNVFECGGVAVGACISHKIADAMSYFMFLKSWAATALGNQKDLVHKPEFVSANLFPPRNLSGFNPSTGITKEKIVSKWILFSSSKIESLKAKYTAENQNQKPPSRVEALSAFIWSRFVAATQANSAAAPEKLYIVLHAVNLRTRMDPPLPQHSFGNLYRIAVTLPCLNTGEECYGLVRQMRDSISKIDCNYIKKLQDCDKHLDVIKEHAEKFIRGEMAVLNFTSWCRFPLHEADFGWGKPVWVGVPPMTFKNLIVFKDTKFGDGIEAYLGLEEEDMVKLESDEGVLSICFSNWLLSKDVVYELPCSGP